MNAVNINLALTVNIFGRSVFPKKRNKLNVVRSLILKLLAHALYQEEDNNAAPRTTKHATLANNKKNSRREADVGQNFCASPSIVFLTALGRLGPCPDPHAWTVCLSPYQYHGAYQSRVALLFCSRIFTGEILKMRPGLVEFGHPRPRVIPCLSSAGQKLCFSSLLINVWQP